MYTDEYVNKNVEIDWVTKSNNAAQQLVERANREFPFYSMCRSYTLADKVATYEFKFTVSNAEAMTLIAVLEQMEGVQ